MTDPLGELKDSLAYMFELQRISETGKYISPFVQNLQLALDNYQSSSLKSLNTLISAVKKALPVIENYADSYTVKKKVEALAGARGKSIHWFTSPQFPFGTIEAEDKTDYQIQNPIRL